MTMIFSVLVKVVAVVGMVVTVATTTVSSATTKVVDAFALSPKVVVQRRTTHVSSSFPQQQRNVAFLKSEPFDDGGDEESQLDFDHDDQFQMMMDDRALMEEIKSKTFFPLQKEDDEGMMMTKTQKNKNQQQQQQQQQQQTYRMGGDAHYTAGMVDPSSLSQEDADGCDEPFVDLMTGDELCWGVDPAGMDKNVVAAAAVNAEETTPHTKPPPSTKSKSNANIRTTKTKTIKVDELYRSGGHAEFNHPFHLQHHDQDHLTYEPTLNDRKHHHLLYHKHPTLLTDQEVEDCTGEPYIDFATGDELCWPS